MLKDRLKDMFQKQKAFQIKLDGWIGNWITAKLSKTEIEYGLDFQQEMTKETVLQLFSEVNEVLNEINWKHHKEPALVDKEKIKEEIIDIQHFVINLCLIWEIDFDEFYKIFVKKNKKNYERFIK